MPAVLGIDAAWTATAASGVALAVSSATGWHCIAAAPSIEQFVDLAAGVPVDFTRAFRSERVPSVTDILTTAHALAVAPVDLVAIDMPIANIPITGRRVADRLVAAQFGGRGCSTHTPSVNRPGAIGAKITSAFDEAGFQIATSATRGGTLRRLVEVYPHPALLVLLNRSYRVPYKVARARRYWPGCSHSSALS